MKFFIRLLVISAVMAAPSVGAQPMEGFADMVERVSPAVVNISTSIQPSDISSAAPNPALPAQNPFAGTPFEGFFDDFLQGLPNGGSMGAQNSLGSGVIISADGYVVTNNHVVEKADAIVVTLSDETDLKAKVIGTDPKTDLALLKITRDAPFPFITMGNSDALRVGDWVLAIGNPFGFGGTVTAGIISARGRHIGAGPYDDFLQTDTAINPGNSGGALLNNQGELVGVPSIIAGRGTNVGIGFAIPVDTVQLIVRQIKEFGAPVRGWLGVQIQSVDDDLSRVMKLQNKNGALVSAINPGSPAEKAGFKTGDVIIAYNGKPVNKVVDLPRQVAETRIGTRVDVLVVRDGKRLTLNPTLSKMAEETALNEATPATGKAVHPSLFGLQVADLTDILRQRFGLEKGAHGVVVIAIDRKSPAADANLRVGDVVLKVNQQTIRTEADMRQAMAADTDNSLLLLVSRGGSHMFVALNKNTQP